MISLTTKASSLKACQAWPGPLEAKKICIKKSAGNRRPSAGRAYPSLSVALPSVIRCSNARTFTPRHARLANRMGGVTQNPQGNAPDGIMPHWQGNAKKTWAILPMATADVGATHWPNV